MHPKVNVLGLFIYLYMPEKWLLLRKIIVWIFSCLLLFPSSLPPGKFHWSFIITTFLCHEPLLLFIYLILLERLFCFSRRKTRWTMLVDNVGLKICLLGTSNSMVTLTFFFLGVNRTGSGTSSITNHKFHKALGRLHGPWVNIPLWVTSFECYLTSDIP